MNNDRKPKPIVSSDAPITVVGGAKVTRADLSTALKFAPTVVAADGGANDLGRCGIKPVAVIGDLDSLTDDARQLYHDRLHMIEEQDSVDFDKALRHVSAPVVVAVGVTGGRLDHQLAVLNVLVRHADRPCILLGEGSVTCLCPPEVSLPVAAGTIVSLFPMAAVGVASVGLEWPTDGLAFSPDGRIGTSNTATGPIRLVPDAPAMLLILPDDQLGVLIEALSLRGAPTWPAPAG